MCSQGYSRGEGVELRIALEPRGPTEKRNPLLYGLAGLAAGFALSILLGALTPVGVTGVARALYVNLSEPRFWLLSLPYFAPIAASAAGLTLAYRAGFITIGSEGQVILGAVAAYGLLYFTLSQLHPVLALAVAMAAAALTGALYGLVVGVLRVYLGANETLVSLMLNYIAVALVNYLVAGPWQSGPFTRTEPLPDRFWISGPASAIVATIFIVLLEALYVYTRLGIAVDSISRARRAAETYGIDPGRAILVVAALAGAAAGLGGGLYMAAEQHQLLSLGKQGLGYGYMGILAAWLAGLRPAATIAAGLLITLLYNMFVSLQLQGIPASFVLAFEAVIVLSVLASTTLSRYRVVIRHG